MDNLFAFSVVKITEGQYQGRMGRLYDKVQTNSAQEPDEQNLMLRVVPDKSLGKLNILPELSQRSRHPRQTYCVFPPRVIEFVDMSQPTDEFMTGYAERFREIILAEMEACIDTKLILERISTLGELYDLVTLQGVGWQATFWERYVRIFGPQYKKRPKSAMKLC